MSYTLDIKCILVLEYKERLRNQTLLPGRVILKENLDGNFSKIVDTGIKNLDELKKALSTPAKIKAYSERSGVSRDYLTILKREIGSLLQKPARLTDIPDVDGEVLALLESAGIRTTKDYYEQATGDIRNAAEKLKLGIETANEIYCLCDLCRINGIGPAAARIFFEAGYKSMRDVAAVRAPKLLDDITRVNDERRYYGAGLGLKDMQFCIDYAKLMLSLEG